MVADVSITEDAGVLTVSIADSVDTGLALARHWLSSGLEPIGLSNSGVLRDS